jgi:hypothetical protein
MEAQMKQILMLSAAGVGVFGLWTTTVSADPSGWVLALASIAGAGFIGRPKTKPSMDVED